MKKYFILLKTHKITGLKYLCRHITENESTCYSYLGSGTRWRRHLSVHGIDIDTIILKECASVEEAKEVGLYYSNLWKVVEDPNFANLIPEYGQGGSAPAKLRKNHTGWRGFKMIGDKNPSKRDDVKEKISKRLKGRVFSDEWKKKLSDAAIGRPSPKKR